MNAKKIYIINIVTLFFTVPWFFNKNDLESFFGFPYWAFYSLFGTFIYAIVTYYCINKYWFISESDNFLKK
tara:strand:+ start:412 stop:624 length:213 start_codon:yes stop_codon:yes gene_type:complete